MRFIMTRSNRIVMLGLGILALSLILPGRSALGDEGHSRGLIQEGLGRAIAVAALAQTETDRAQAQEVLGSLIAQDALVEHEAGPPPVRLDSVHHRGNETKGEPLFWTLSAFGGLAVLILAFFGVRAEPVPRIPAIATK